MTGAASPASISAICFAKAEAASPGCCRGPFWFAGRRIVTGFAPRRPASPRSASAATFDAA